MVTRQIVDALHRRPPGERCLLYLDQWALTGMAKAEDPEYVVLRARLRSDVIAGAVLCPVSHEHRSESILAPEALWQTMDTLGDELSMGISFLGRREIENREIEVAAATFAEAPSLLATWQEAFSEDPHISREELYTEFVGGGQVRVRASMSPSEPEREEVRQQKAAAGPMQAAYDELRAAGLSFGELAEANLDAMLRWKLGPLFDPAGFCQRYNTRLAEAQETGSRESMVALITLGTRRDMVASLITRFPAVVERVVEFWESETLRCMPSLRYPALLRAALAVGPSRRAWPGDEFDVEHLARGLSRCDIVTTDKAMAHLLTQHELVPSSCALVTAAEGPAGIIRALDAFQVSP